MQAGSRDESGFSLVELMVVCLLLGVTLAAAYSMMSAVSAMTNKMSARASAAEESQAFVDTITRELQQANSLKSIAGASTANADAQAALYDIQPRRIGFYVDINRDGKPERVAYYISGTSLLREQTTSSNATYPYSWAASSPPLPVVETIDPDWSGPIFTYYGTGDWPPPQITSASQAAAITVVGVEIRNLASWSDQSISYEASSTARVRSIGNGF